MILFCNICKICRGRQIPRRPQVPPLGPLLLSRLPTHPQNRASSDTLQSNLPSQNEICNRGRICGSFESLPCVNFFLFRGCAKEGKYIHLKRQYWHCTAWDSVFLVNSHAFVSRGSKLLKIGFFKMQPNIVVILSYKPQNTLHFDFCVCAQGKRSKKGNF